jgi:hypothetical protein
MSVSTSTSDLSYVGKTLIPTEFTYVGSVMMVTYENELGESDGETIAEFESERAEELFNENADAFYAQQFSCNCCNHKIKHSQWFEHESGSIHAVGNDCGGSIMKYRVDIAGAKKQSLAIKQKQDRINKLFAIEQTYPELLKDMEMYHPIIVSIREGMLKYAKISQKQVDLVAKLATERRERELTCAEAPTGKKVKIDEMTIVKASFKIVPSFTYGGYASGKIAVTLQHESGYKIHTSIRSVGSDDASEYTDLVEWYNGKTVKNLLFSSVDASKDTLFAFGKRLSRAKATKLHFLDDKGNEVVEPDNIY